MSEEKAASSPASRALRWLVLGIAVAMSLYHMYVAGFGPPEAMVFRGTHLLFALTLVFLLYPSRAGGGAGWRLLDAVLLVGGWSFVLHIFFNYEYYTNRTIYIDELNAWDKFYAVVAVLVVLEATRRVIGWALPLTAIAFLAYAIGFTNVTMQNLMEQVYLSLEGIFGSTLGVSASYV
ncbi:MAG: C4-dicarboxylate ABC transporter permease, partial [Betaproteobacteria bacterium]|nr:C4-dicarboxylate ABC transporter permease [Betaproteobacteria bacterium]